MALYPGYTGIASINNLKIRCGTFDINPKQEILWYEHIAGLRDSLTGTLDTKGEISSSSIPNNLQKTLFRPSVKITEGSMSFPLTENIAKDIFILANRAETFDLDFDYYCDSSRKIKDCKISSYTFNVSSGDIANVSLNIISKSIEDFPSSNIVNLYTDSEKILTWDNVNISVSNSDTNENWDNICEFEMSINNNIKPVYTSGYNRLEFGNLNPLELRVGMQHVLGTITKYNKNYSAKSVYGPVNIDVSYGDVSFSLKTILTPLTTSGSVQVVKSSYGYECIDYYFY